MNLDNEVTSISTDTLNYLESNIGRDGISKVIKIFLDELPRTETILQNCISSKNLQEIHKIGHKNKTASLTVGAKGLAGLYSELEKSEKIETAMDLANKIHEVASAVNYKLNQYLAHA